MIRCTCTTMCRHAHSNKMRDSSGLNGTNIFVHFSSINSRTFSSPPLKFPCLGLWKTSTVKFIRITDLCYFLHHNIFCSVIQNAYATVQLLVPSAHIINIHLKLALQLHCVSFDIFKLVYPPFNDPWLWQSTFNNFSVQQSDSKWAVSISIKKQE
jgi:hypothetical protein